ncbi:hypothetical protein HN807_03005 [Candidatus Bathyarchaeota archaeon]|mgnify:CR=1 FL=1|jgi:hypothetical protein|nr:hypothetical protein [Candidatus Bathyarchaeota archaeon]MBT4319452.1 hypothetical protein [Candidatus Bathyarchaeota archaeon]MBT4423702.1 hypothetical protein [Candidatus Bathyarchaeota archaeon]MBT5643484.1 hypothetical protein [Candidatus Bathyarchaeota archaeon]MBT6605227.1 hypothetical protein [Candidatus Bathyarchaeota archaeon]
MPESSKTVIEIDYGDADTAKAIQKAITPDNLNVPDGMHIITVVEGTVLEIEVHTERSIGSLVATLDDMLSCIQAAEMAIEDAVK